MANIITGGLSFALMSADSSAKAALKPMNMVSRELHKRNPDLELIERAGMYGGKELDKAGASLARAQEELKESQRAARQEEKAAMEKRLEEKAAEKAAEREAGKAAEQEQAAEAEAAENMAMEQVQTFEKSQGTTGMDSPGGLSVCGYGQDKDMAEISTEVKFPQRQKYSAAVFRDKVTRLRMDLRG